MLPHNLIWYWMAVFAIFCYLIYRLVKALLRAISR